jgi:hypothetical protein
MKRNNALGLLALVAVCLVSPLAALSAQPTSEAPGEKTAVVDGRYTHDIGDLWHHTTNWGLLGSMHTLPTTFSDAPSAMWPGGSGDEYLWAAGLWVGGRVLGEELVSTGGYPTEFMCTDAVGDTIHVSQEEMAGGARYPWPGSDDDGDGLEDEEFHNGVDDDGDGLVDEDYAAMSDQLFTATYRDNMAVTQENHPDHTPLNIQVVQRSLQWGDPLLEDFVGYDFTITNIGVMAIEDVYLGLFSDFDIASRGNSGGAQDDYAGFLSTEYSLRDGSTIPLRISYMYDGAAANPLPGYAGWVLCGHTLDPTGSAAPAAVEVHSWQHYSGQAAFEQGGDPTNDSERYQVLSDGDFDGNVLPGRQNDYRVVMSSGPFATLAPGESLSYQVALVLGGSLEELKHNAAQAVLAYRGQAYDRDGDPANGAEFVVNWLPESAAPVAAGWGAIQAQVQYSRSVELRIETNLAPDEEWQVLRRASPRVVARTWTVQELEALGMDHGRFLYGLEDEDDTGWPRTYVLQQISPSGLREMGQTELSAPGVFRLLASPNPFNPQVEISFSTRPGERARVQVFDLRGRLVANLFDGVMTAGSRSLIWDGRDRQGRALASGVYEVMMLSDDRVLRRRVTLVR